MTNSRFLVGIFVFAIISVLPSPSLAACFPEGCVTTSKGDLGTFVDVQAWLLTGVSMVFGTLEPQFSGTLSYTHPIWHHKTQATFVNGQLTNLVCFNGLWVKFTHTTCTNGATNFPSCNNNVCTNGATNFPTCSNNVCTNGATNFPSCNNNVPECSLPAICSNGNLVNACTGSVVQTCVAGCGAGSCNAACPEETICKPNNDRYKRGANCQETLIESCSMQCYTSGSSQNYCQGNDIYRNSGPCTSQFVQTCAAPFSAGCSEGACLPPLAPKLEPISVTFNGTTFNSDGHIHARPPLVNRGDTAQIYWNATNVSSCSVTGSNGDAWNATSGGTAGRMTSPLFAGTTYTLVCTPLAGSSASQIRESVDVNIVPVFNEI